MDNLVGPSPDAGKSPVWVCRRFLHSPPPTPMSLFSTNESGTLLVICSLLIYNYSMYIYIYGSSKYAKHMILSLGRTFSMKISTHCTLSSSSIRSCCILADELAWGGFHGSMGRKFMEVCRTTTWKMSGWLTYSHHPWKEGKMIWTKPPGNYVPC